MKLVKPWQLQYQTIISIYGNSFLLKDKENQILAAGHPSAPFHFRSKGGGEGSNTIQIYFLSWCLNRGLAKP